MKKKNWMVICLTAISIPVSAQEADTTKNLNEVIVTATRTEKNVMDVGRSVTVLKPEDFQNGNYQNLGELLNTIEGIYISGSQHNAGANQSVFTRGTNSNHTVVMIDGVRITDPSGVNNAIDLSEISLSNIDQIEIVKGAHSTLYGSSAIGGVINIITRKPKDGLSVNVCLNAGSFGKSTLTHTQNAYINYAKKGWFIGGEIFHQKTNGFDATEDTMIRNGITKMFDEDNFSKLDYMIKGGYKSDKTYGYFSYKNSDQVTDIDKVYQGTSKYYNPWGSHPEIYYDGNYTLDFNRKLFTYGIQHQFSERFALNYYGGYTSMLRTSIDDSTEILPGEYDKVYFRGDFEGSVLSNELQGNYKMENLQFIIGGSHYSEKMNVNTFYRAYSDWFMAYDTTISSLDTILPEISTISGYAQIEMNGKLLDEKFSYFNLNIGFRFNNYEFNTLHNDYYFDPQKTDVTRLWKNQINYSINPFIKPDDNSIIYFNYSTGFNAPSLYQLFSPDSNYQSGITMGNAFLKPENSTSLELGIKKKISDQLSFGFSVFSNTIENTIEYVYLWNKEIGLDTLGNDWMRDDYFGDTYINLGTMRNKGCEISVEAKIHPKLIVAANLSLISGKLEYDPSTIDTSHTHGHHVQIRSNGEFINKTKSSSILTRRPSTANINLQYFPFKNFAINFIMQYTDNRYDVFYNELSGPYGALNSRPVESYSLFHLNMNYLIKEKWNVSLRVENLTDTEYRQIVGYNTRGRSYYLGLVFRF